MLFKIEAGVRTLQVEDVSDGYWYDEVVSHEAEIPITDLEAVTKDEVLNGGELHQTLIVGMNKARGWIKNKRNSRTSEWGQAISGLRLESEWETAPLLSGAATDEVFRYWYDGASRIYYLKLSWELHEVTVKPNQSDAMERLMGVQGSVDELIESIKRHRDTHPYIADKALQNRQVWGLLTITERVTLNTLINFSAGWTPDIEEDDSEL